MIDAAFMLALAVSLLKFGDLVLRPHQKKRVQEVVDSAAIRMDDFAKLYRRTPGILLGIRPRYLFGAAIIGLTVGVLFVGRDSRWEFLTGMLLVYTSTLVILGASAWRHAEGVFKWVGIGEAEGLQPGRLFAAGGGAFVFMVVKAIPHQVADEIPILSLMNAGIGLATVGCMLFAPSTYRRWIFFSEILSSHWRFSSR